MPRKGPNTSLLDHTSTALHALLSYELFAFPLIPYGVRAGGLTLDLVVLLRDPLIIATMLMLFSRFLLLFFSIL